MQIKNTCHLTQSHNQIHQTQDSIMSVQTISNTWLSETKQDEGTRRTENLHRKNVRERKTGDENIEHTENKKQRKRRKIERRPSTGTTSTSVTKKAASFLLDLSKKRVDEKSTEEKQSEGGDSTETEFLQHDSEDEYEEEVEKNLARVTASNDESDKDERNKGSLKRKSHESKGLFDEDDSNYDSDEETNATTDDSKTTKSRPNKRSSPRRAKKTKNYAEN
jgi:hypothetical protein